MSSLNHAPSSTSRARGLGARLRRLAAACVVLPALLAGAMALAAERGADEAFWEGYIAAILERDLGWSAGTFEVQVRQRRATVVIHSDEPGRREAAERALATVAGLEQVRVIVSGGGRPGGDVPILFPVGDLFRPLVADPKQPQFFISLIEVRSPAEDITAASVGYGENFGLWRWPGAEPGDGWQLSFAGGLFAQFNLDAPSSDLVNADYNVGFGLTYRRASYSARLRVYHTSSHLGDEFLINQPNVERINLSVEAVDAVASYEWERWRVYGGAGYLIGRDPGDLEPGFAEAGVEYRGQRFRWDLGRLVAGVHLRSTEEHDWRTAKSAKIGLELGQADPGRRRVRLMAEYYKGFSPFGQFFDTEIRYAGLGVYFGF